MAAIPAQTVQTPRGPVRAWSDAEKLGEAMRLSLPLLGPGVRRQIEGLLTVEALAVIAAVLVVWIGAHFFGIGFVADAILLIAGIVAIGTVVFEGVDHLYRFADKALTATRTADLALAADHFAKAVTILGVEAVLTLLFRGAPRTFRGQPAPIGPAPAISGRRYRPGLRGTRDPLDVGAPPRTPPQSLVGAGGTTPFGDIYIFRPRLSDFPPSAAGVVRNETRAAAYHEAVHRALTPKLNVLWRFRVQGRTFSYERSSLSRYLEEALAETVAQVGLAGFRASFRGLSFPMQGDYVTLIRKSVNPDLGTPVLREIAGIFAGGFILHGMQFEIFISDHPPPPLEDDE